MGEVLPFARRLSVFLPVVKVFHIQTALPSVYPPCFFHKLKTLWRKFKTQAFKPVFRVEFHTFHKVFHNLISTGSEPCIHFVIFKSELWQNFEAERHLFCLFIQHHFDECGSLLKIVRFGASAAGLAGCCRSLYKMLHPTYFSVFWAHCWPRKLRFGYKNSPVDWFYPLFGVYLGCNFVKPCTKRCVGTNRPR